MPKWMGWIGAVSGVSTAGYVLGFTETGSPVPDLATGRVVQWGGMRGHSPVFITHAEVNAALLFAIPAFIALLWWSWSRRGGPVRPDHR